MVGNYCFQYYRSTPFGIDLLYQWTMVGPDHDSQTDCRHRANGHYHCRHLYHLSVLQPLQLLLVLPMLWLCHWCDGVHLRPLLPFYQSGYCRVNLFNYVSITATKRKVQNQIITFIHQSKRISISYHTYPHCRCRPFELCQ